MNHREWFRKIARPVLAAGAIAMLAAAASCTSRRGGEGSERPAKSAAVPGTLTAANGETVLTLTAAAASRLGIGLATLTARLVRAERTAPATVLPAQDLVTFRNDYAAALAQAAITRSESGYAAKEYQRLKGLYAENQNISQKALEEAEAASEAAQAREQAAERQLRLQSAALRQRWGPVVTRWAVADSGVMTDLLAQSEWLVQLTMPPGLATRAGPPDTVWLELPSGGRVAAHFISGSPLVDPRVQGVTYLYRVAAAGGISAGANLLAHFPVGRASRGVVAPGPAVVWSEGRAWVYEQKTATEFVRRAIPTGEPVGDGYLLPGGFPAGMKVVVRGAQSLLSEELLLGGSPSARADEDPE